MGKRKPKTATSEAATKQGAARWLLIPALVAVVGVLWASPSTGLLAMFPFSLDGKGPPEAPLSQQQQSSSE